VAIFQEKFWHILIVDTLGKVAFQFVYRNFQTFLKIGILKTKMSYIPENDNSEKSSHMVLQCVFLMDRKHPL